MPITTQHALDLARRVRAHIRSHPEQHDQSVFYLKSHCGTAACIAGWTAVLNGADLDTRYISRSDGLKATKVRMPSTDRFILIDDYAGGVLGLTDEESRDLFSGDTTEAEALAVLDALIADGEQRQLTGGKAAAQ